MRKDLQAKVLTGLLLAGVVVFVAVKQGGWKAPDGSSAAELLSVQPRKPVEPRETIYAMLDAARDGDVVAYLACFTGETLRQLEQSRNEMTAETFATYLQERNREIKGIAINEPEKASETEVRVRVEYVYQDRNEAQQVFLSKLGDDWKITGLGNAERVKTLVPYGTPVY